MEKNRARKENKGNTQEKAGFPSLMEWSWKSLLRKIFAQRL